MRLSISEILEKADAAENEAAVVQTLTNNDGPVLRQIIKNIYDPDIKFLLPEGAPPYKENDDPGATMILYAEARRLYLFIEGQSPPNLKPVKREMLFLELLQMVSAKDAKLLVAMKDKTMPYPTLTKRIIRRAFPKLV